MTALLDQEHESVDALAQAVLDLLMDIKWNHQPWIAIQRNPKSAYFTAWGPYATRGEAERDIGKRIIAAEPGDVAYFCKVWNKDVTEGEAPEIWEESNE